TRSDRDWSSDVCSSDLVILKGMQCSRALRLLPVVVSLAAPAAAQQRWRVTNDGAWFYQTVSGKRLARLARGAILSGVAQDGAIEIGRAACRGRVEVRVG